ncbi:hypothetical protein GCM10027590_35670 [Nocardiopsis nanhaiensis]
MAGVDLGLTSLAVVADSDGGVWQVANPRHLEGALTDLRRACRRVSRRRGPDRRTGRPPSKRWVKADRARNRVHHRVANVRTDALHHLTTSVAREYGTVVIEDLNVAGMVKNRRLARRISDAGFGQIRRQLDYKTAWNGGRLVVADRWFASSKTCSGCGATKAKLPLHVRVFDCDACPLVLDRDVNAARNLAALAAQVGSTVPEWPETGERGLRRPVEPTVGPAPPAPAAGRVRGGPVAQDRTSGRKRDTVVRTPNPGCGDPVTDLSCTHARDADDCLRHQQRYCSSHARAHRSPSRGLPYWARNWASKRSGVISPMSAVWDSPVAGGCSFDKSRLLEIGGGPRTRVSQRSPAGGFQAGGVP